MLVLRCILGTDEGVKQVSWRRDDQLRKDNIERRGIVVYVQGGRPIILGKGADAK